MGSLCEGFPGKKETVCQSTERTQTGKKLHTHTRAALACPKDGHVCVFYWEVPSLLEF